MDPDAKEGNFVKFRSGKNSVKVASEDGILLRKTIQ